MKINLSRPTNRTSEGPRFRLERSQLTLEYDSEADDGSIEWSKVVFREVLTFEYRQESCCAPESVVGSRQIYAPSESPYLDEVLSRWQTSVGWQAWQQRQGGAERFRNFILFFDGAGA